MKRFQAGSLISIWILLVNSSRIAICTDTSNESDHTSHNPSESSKQGTPGSTLSSTTPVSPGQGSTTSGYQDQQPEKELEAVELNIKNNKQCDHYTYTHDSKTKTASFVPKSNYCFNSVSQDKTEIWKSANPKEYSNKVVTDGEGPSSKKVSIYLLNDTIKNFNKTKKKGPWTERSPLIDLDLNDKKSTHEFDYSKDAKTNTATYTTKNGFLFKSLLQKKNKVWDTSNPCDYLNKVEFRDHGNNKLDLTLYPSNNTKLSFHKPDKNSPWKETTALKVTFSTFDEKDRTTKENDVSQYKLKEDSDGLYTCQFKSGAKCSEFKLNNDSVWKHDKDRHKDQFPFELSFSLQEVTLKLSNLFLKYSYKNDKWNFKTKALFDSFNNKFFTLVTSENEDTSSTSENNPSHYDLSSDSDGQFLLNFKDNVNLLEIKFDAQSVWKHDKNKHKDLFPNSFTYKPRDLLSLDFYPFYYLYTFDSSNVKWDLKDDSSYNGSLPLVSSEHPKNVNVVTADDPSSLGGNSTQNDTNKYKVYNDGQDASMFIYVFNPGVKCVEVKLNDKPLWKNDLREHRDKFPKTLRVNSRDSVFDLDFEGATVGFKLTDKGLDNYTKNLGKFTTHGTSITDRNLFTYTNRSIVDNSQPGSSQPNYQLSSDGSVSSDQSSESQSQSQSTTKPKIPDVSPAQPTSTTQSQS